MIMKLMCYVCCYLGITVKPKDWPCQLVNVMEAGTVQRDQSLQNQLQPGRVENVRQETSVPMVVLVRRHVHQGTTVKTMVS